MSMKDLYNFNYLFTFLNMLENKPEILTIQEVAEILNVSTQTIRRWDNQGILKSFRASKTHPRRYHKKDIVAYLQSTPQSGE
jgi:excisionase family DNA binding protein